MIALRKLSERNVNGRAITIQRPDAHGEDVLGNLAASSPIRCTRSRRECSRLENTGAAGRQPSSDQQIAVHKSRERHQTPPPQGSLPASAARWRSHTHLGSGFLLACQCSFPFRVHYFTDGTGRAPRIPTPRPNLPGPIRPAKLRLFRNIPARGGRSDAAESPEKLSVETKR